MREVPRNRLNITSLGTPLRGRAEHAQSRKRTVALRVQWALLPAACFMHSAKRGHRGEPGLTVAHFLMVIMESAPTLVCLAGIGARRRTFGPDRLGLLRLD